MPPSIFPSYCTQICVLDACESDIWVRACCKIFGYLPGMANLYNYPVKQHGNHTIKPPTIIVLIIHHHHHLDSNRACHILCLSVVVNILWPCLPYQTATESAQYAYCGKQTPVRHDICHIFYTSNFSNI